MIAVDYIAHNMRERATAGLYTCPMAGGVGPELGKRVRGLMHGDAISWTLLARAGSPSPDEVPKCV